MRSPDANTSPPTNGPDLDELVEQIETALGRPLRRTKAGPKATIKACVRLAREEARTAFPDAAAGAKAAGSLECAIAGYSDTMQIPIRGGAITMLQLRDALGYLRGIEGPSAKQDTAKMIIAEIAAGLTRELSVKPRRVYREVASLLHEAVFGHSAELKHQVDTVIRNRKICKNW
jgi:hypothetical protein